MAKYSFDRLGADRFEEMVKALLETRFRLSGNLIQFGDGPDGAREATWTQPPTHPTWQSPGSPPRSREWVFQAKYHLPSPNSRRTPTELVEQDLKRELDKIVNRHRVPCDTYVLITNVPLTGVRHRGSRDRLKLHIDSRDRGPNDIQLWDACDITAMLDGAPKVRQTFLDAVLPGDILAALLRSFEGDRQRIRHILRSYLDSILDPEGQSASARTTEAGDDSDRALKLKDVYVDLPVAPSSAPPSTMDHPEFGRGKVETVVAPSSAPPSTMDQLVHELRQMAKAAEPSATPAPPPGHAFADPLPSVPASLVLLCPAQDTTLLLAGPGYGKSTLAQFLTLYHAARIVEGNSPVLLADLRRRLQLPKGLCPEMLESSTPARIPFRIELRRYTEWLHTQSTDGGIARFIAERLVKAHVECDIGSEDIFSLCEENPTLLILDGLDEVPNTDDRKSIVGHLQAFIRRLRNGAEADLDVLLTSRPQGYNEEFLLFQPSTWLIQDLDSASFEHYCNAWLQQRIHDSQDRSDALKRITAAMGSPEVQLLATTLLHVTVMLSLVRSRRDIPHERTTLFQRFVDVVFERERDKWPHVRPYERELRRLHGEVAFAIHRDMEIGRPDSLSHQMLRDLALRTWESFRGDDVSSCTLRTAINAIIETARDRLVFLKGQGANQEQIGFLLASYREYFAADYLRGHECADRDQAFSALVLREAHWENVLRFYAGFQEPSVQVDWIDRLSAVPTTQSAAALTETVQRRRLLLRLLPEFKDLQRASFQRGLDEVFAADTVWSWLGVDWAKGVLRGMRGGAALPWIWDRVRPLLDSTDRETVAAALDIALSLRGHDGRLPDDYLAALLSLLRRDTWVKPLLIRMALAANCIDVLDKVTAHDLVQAADDAPLDVVIREDTPLRLGVAARLLIGATFQPFHALHARHSIFGKPTLGSFEVPVGPGTLGLNCNLFGGNRRVSDESKAVIAEFCGAELSLGNAIIHALERPLDQVVNDRAVGLWEQYRKQYPRLHPFGRAQSHLVPAKGAFYSSAAHEEYWKARREAILDLPAAYRRAASLLKRRRWDEGITGSSENWLLGVCSAELWDQLPAARLITEDALLQFRRSVLGRLIENAPSSPMVFSEFRPSERANSDGVLAVVPSVIRIFEPSGTGLRINSAFASSWIWGALLSLRPLTPAVLGQIVEAIERVSAADNELPRDVREWLLAIICDHAPERLDLMLQLWCDDIDWIPTSVRGRSQLDGAALTKRGSEQADGLLGALMACRRVDVSSAEVSDALYRLLERNDSHFERRVEAATTLSNGPLVGALLDLWGKPDTWVDKNFVAFAAPEVARQLVAETAVPDSAALNSTLVTILDNRQKYPSMLVNAALTRSIALRSAGQGTMEDSAWQKKPRGRVCS